MFSVLSRQILIPIFHFLFIFINLCFESNLTIEITQLIQIENNTKIVFPAKFSFYVYNNIVMVNKCCIFYSNF